MPYTEQCDRLIQKLFIEFWKSYHRFVIPPFENHRKLYLGFTIQFLASHVSSRKKIHMKKQLNQWLMKKLFEIQLNVQNIRIWKSSSDQWTRTLVALDNKLVWTALSLCQYIQIKNNGATKTVDKIPINVYRFDCKLLAEGKSRSIPMTT